MKKRGQIAMEYLLLTAFILISVGAIFAFSFVNYNQNIRVTRANEALAKMSTTADELYIRGGGNTRFINISLPEGLTEMKVLHKCVGESPNQGTMTECGGTYDHVKFSTISMKVELIGGESTIIKETKAKIVEEFDSDPGEDAKIKSGGYAGSSYPVRVSLTDTGLVKFEKV